MDIITTAVIPGRPAPKLLTAQDVAGMKPGSAIVDMAAGQGGNVEGSVAWERVGHGQRRRVPGLHRHSRAAVGPGLQL